MAARVATQGPGEAEGVAGHQAEATRSSAAPCSCNQEVAAGEAHSEIRSRCCQGELPECHHQGRQNLP